MKKRYIGSIAFFVAGCSLACAGTVTVETAEKDNQGTYYGFTLALGSGSAALTDPGNILAEHAGTLVSLDSVDVLARSNGSYEESRLAVYSFVEDGNVGDFIGLSESVSFSPDTNLNFQFEGIELELGKRYQFLFVDKNATATLLTNSDESTIPLLTLYQQHAMPLGIAVTADQYTGSLLPSGWGIYKSSGLNSWEGHRMPVASVTVSSVEIPEPGTFGVFAGVGVLLLAVSRRRRRKNTTSDSREGEISPS